MSERVYQQDGSHSLLYLGQMWKRLSVFLAKFYLLGVNLKVQSALKGRRSSKDINTRIPRILGVMSRSVFISYLIVSRGKLWSFLEEQSQCSRIVCDSRIILPLFNDWSYHLWFSPSLFLEVEVFDECEILARYCERGRRTSSKQNCCSHGVCSLVKE